LDRQPVKVIEEVIEHDFGRGVEMKLRVLAFGIVIWLASSATASADSLILIHGYLGSAGSWRGSGITSVL